MREIIGTDEDLDKLLADVDDGIRVREDLLQWRDAALLNYRPHNVWSYLGYVIEDNDRTARAALGCGLTVGCAVGVLIGIIGLVSYGIAHV